MNHVMDKEIKNTSDKKDCKSYWLKRGKSGCSDGSSGLVWLLGFIGASVYYVQQAQSFADGAWGIAKALVWPAILVYKLIGFLG